MTSKALIAATVIALMGSSALAADKHGPAIAAPVQEIHPVAAAYNWGGAYAGAHFGMDTENSDATFAGLHVGYRAQHKHVVMGIEAEAAMATDNFKHMNAEHLAFTGSVSLGYAFDRFMPYVKLGYMTANDLDGLTYGAGIAYAMTDRVHLSLEGMRMEISGVDANTATARIGFKF